MHSEYLSYVTDETASLLNEVEAMVAELLLLGRLQHEHWKRLPPANDGKFSRSGWTNIFIYPGYEFKAIDGMITNFHLPKSTLIMLSVH